MITELWDWILSSTFREVLDNNTILNYTSQPLEQLCKEGKSILEVKRKKWKTMKTSEKLLGWVVLRGSFSWPVREQLNSSVLQETLRLVGSTNTEIMFYVMSKVGTYLEAKPFLYCVCPMQSLMGWIHGFSIKAFPHGIRLLSRCGFEAVPRRFFRDCNCILITLK